MFSFILLYYLNHDDVTKHFFFLHLKNQILGQDISSAPQYFFIISGFTFIEKTAASAIWILHLARVLFW